ncbi:MAG TPA: M56 family metallopeptidase [Candidatus Limnocylindria bacterium]|nr:M56 family metallopeptidase [Candidatus Limnocylindria bacterium]
MARADRAFGALVASALTLSALLAVPLALTLFPALIERLVRGSSDALFYCTGVLTSVHRELPPFGAAALSLAAIAVAPASVRAVRLLRARAHAVVAVDMPVRLRDAAARARVSRRVVCVDDASRYAYCAGLWSPRIYVSLGAVRALSGSELEAVLWHEAHHLQRRDPLRTLVARSLAALFAALPLIAELAARFEVAKELDADRAALRAQGTPRGIAGALLVLGSTRTPPRRIPVSAWSLASVRIDQLAGVEPKNLLPGISRRAILLTGIALVIALTIALGQAVRAHFLPLDLVPETAGAVAHLCPLPISGPLL